MVGQSSSSASAALDQRAAMRGAASVLSHIEREGVSWVAVSFLATWGQRLGTRPVYDAPGNSRPVRVSTGRWQRPVPVHATARPQPHRFASGHALDVSWLQRQSGQATS